MLSIHGLFVENIGLLYVFGCRMHCLFGKGIWTQHVKTSCSFLNSLSLIACEIPFEFPLGLPSVLAFRESRKGSGILSIGSTCQGQGSRKKIEELRKLEERGWKIFSLFYIVFCNGHKPLSLYFLVFYFTCLDQDRYRMG